MLAALLSCLTACSETTAPRSDNPADGPGVSLAIQPKSESSCQQLPYYSVDPTALLRGRWNDDALAIRWDLDDDGRWDTPFSEVAPIIDFTLSLPPVDTWTVRYEIRDASANVTACEASLEVPSWVPVPPDIAVGGMRILGTRAKIDPESAPPDTVFAGETIYVCADTRDWLEIGRGTRVTDAILVDGVLVKESPHYIFDPYSYRCLYVCIIMERGIATPGQHTVTTVCDYYDQVAETNERNNSVTHDVVVLAAPPGVRP